MDRDIKKKGNDFEVSPNVVENKEETARSFVAKHEDSFAYLKDVSGPEVYEFYMNVIATFATEYANSKQSKLVELIEAEIAKLENATNSVTNNICTIKIQTLTDLLTKLKQ